VQVQGTPLLVYAVHLETPVQISDAERRDEAMAVAESSDHHPVWAVVTPAPAAPVAAP